MVSVIVPVYNAEKYLNKCIQSILNQTYTEIEIICVDDGSTDSSYSILMSYQERDNRIKVLKQENRGQGPARNLALKYANGEYVMYVDADDWIETRCIENLLDASSNYNTEIIIGRIAKTMLDSEEVGQILTECEKEIIKNSNKKNFLFKITTYPVARLIKRSLLMDNNIEFSNHYFEDVALLPLVYALASSITIIDDVVYYYRNNSCSTVNNLNHIYDRITCLTTLVDGFKKRDLYQIYEEELRGYIIERTQVNLKCVRALSNRIFLNFEKAQNDIIAKNFDLGKLKTYKVYSFGSYGLMVIAKRFMGYEGAALIDNYYGGQSVISCMSPQQSHLLDIKILHENIFRKKCLLQDFEKRFAHLNPGEFGDIDYIFVDLLEERYDIGRCEIGEYFTISDYFKEAETCLTYDVVKAFSEEWFELWDVACRNFVQRLEKYVPEERIVLIKMFLSEKYYSDEGEFLYDNYKQIRKVNECLERCYKIMQQYAPEMLIIDVAQLKTFGTNKSFRHGCYPWHLNDGFYSEVARNIKMQLYMKDMEVE